MLPNLIVKNYRNLSDLKIDSLSRVNLITGRNNTGKTALLEALSIYIACLELSEKKTEFTLLSNNAVYGHLFEWMISILENRGSYVARDFVGNKQKKALEFNVNYESFKSMFSYKEDNTLGSIIIESNNKDISLSLLQKATTFPTQSFLEFKKGGLNESFFLGDLLANDYGRPKNLDFKYIGTNNLSVEDNTDLWDNIHLFPAETDVIKALQIVDSRIKALAFFRRSDSNSIQDAYVKIDDNSPLLPLRSMGDGINRILTIILALVNAKDSYLLIDEFENGLHYSVQEKLWEVIFKTAKELNVQVFATTHSFDCVSAFAKVLSQNEGEGQYIRLQNKKGKIVSVPYSSEDILTATERHIEPR